MKRLSFLLCSICVLALASCSSPQDTILSGKELFPAAEPNIKSLHLTNGTIVVFSPDLGWYDAERGYIEGMTREGVRDTIPISKVEMVQAMEPRPNAALTILAALGIALVFGTVVMVAALASSGYSSGCLVFIGAVGVTAGAALVVFA